MALVTRSIGVVALALLAAGATVACGSSSASTPPPVTPAGATAAEDDDATAGLIEHHRYHHHGGVTLFIAMSLDTLGVSPEQRTAVEKIRADLHARMEPARTAEQSLAAALAEGVASGTFDAPKVDAAVAQVTAAAAAVHDASADALNALHAVLTPPQRAALVDKVESHWAVWENANAEETGADGAKGGHLAILAKELGLTADQVQKIRAALPDGMKGVPRLDRQEISTHLRAFGDAFRSDTFDAKALSTAGGANAHIVGWGVARMARLVETVTPVLTPEQRAKLAQTLRDHAKHNPSAEDSP